MPLTHDLKQTVQERVRNKPDFRIGLLTEAAECLLNDEINVAKTLLRDSVNGTIGFQALGTLTHKNSLSLMRMLSGKGKSSIDNISKALVSLRRHEGIELHVSAR
ncbi:MAG: transcriptional regulator [Alphaproteobacteria bacterium]